MSVHALKSLCRKFALSTGCELHERDPELWELKLSPSLEKAFKSPRLVLCFHRDLLGADPEARMVTLGSPIIQKLRDLLAREGSAGECVLKGPHEVPQALPPGLQGLGIELILDQVELRYRSLAKVHFRATLDGFERVEEFFPVVLDCQTFDEASSQLEGVVKLGSEDHLRGKCLPINRDGLLSKAFTLAESRLKPLVKKFETEAEKEARNEERLAADYYDGLMKTDPSRKGELLEFKRKQMLDIEQRYSIKAELEPRTVVLYRVPFARAEITARRGSRTRQFVLNFDLFEGQWDRIECPAHPGQPLTELTDCPDHGFACKKCYWECKICQRARCSKCARTQCQGCKENHCDTCVLPCTFCSGTYCPSSTQVCQGGCGPVCRGCSINFRGTGLVRCKACVVETNGCHHLELRELVVRCAIDGLECCTRCVASCSDCKRVVSFTHLNRCVLCPPGQFTCQVCSPHLLPDGRRACRRHADYCSCGVYELKKRITVCPEHDRACPSCTWACTACNRKGCSACQQVHCQGCTSVHCQGCSVQCASCKGSFCSKTTRQCEAGCGPVCEGCLVELRGSKRCRKCVVVTNYCKHLESRDAIVTCPVGQEELCSACAKAVAPRCSLCKKQFCSQHVGPCAEGNHMVCDRCSLGLLEGGRACPQHATRCACFNLTLTSEFVECPTHGPCCPKCRWQCPSCKQIRCSHCGQEHCQGCNGIHCKDCSVQCAVCKGSYCRKTTRECEAGCGPVCEGCSVDLRGSKRCRKCVVVTNYCKHLESRDAIVICPVGKEELCSACAQAAALCCSLCKERFCSQHVGPCAEGHHMVCDRCSLRLLEHGRACPQHAARCACGYLALTSKFAECPTHGPRCPKCRWQCPSCKKIRCADCQKVPCSVCKSDHCGECCIHCQACGKTLCRKSAFNCTTGCGPVCPSCAIPTDPTHPLFGKPGVSKQQVPDGKVACKNCSQLCDCSHWELSSKLARCQFTGSFCGAGVFCARCAPVRLSRCASCGRSTCTNCFEPCAGGQEPLCIGCPQVQTYKGERSCPKHATECGCGRIVLVTVFSPCDAHVGCCPECRWHCHSCSAVGCNQCARVRCDYCHAKNCANCVEPCPVCLTMQTRPSSGQFCKSHRCLDCSGQLGCSKHQGVCASCGQKVCHRCLKGNSCQACRTFRKASLEEESVLRQFETELKLLQVPDWKGHLEVSATPAHRKLFRIGYTMSSWRITVADNELKHVIKSTFFGRRDLKGDP